MRRTDELRPPPLPAPAGPPRRVVRSEDIMKGRSEIAIAHGGEEYRLRVTRNGKLILTK